MHALLNQFVLTGGLNLGFCFSDVEKFFKKPLLKICIFCELNFMGNFSNVIMTLKKCDKMSINLLKNNLNWNDRKFHKS